ncbi:conserved hypothetical protein [Ricinus communis]|uniref:Uncharacterized protein n=1 Tax=Ricinus communis TaxID=3988 RepID=B9SHG3_RICCO|nr:conserved hypothetical protein [Ricinus communis]
MVGGGGGGGGEGSGGDGGGGGCLWCSHSKRKEFSSCNQFLKEDCFAPYWSQFEL